MAEIFSRPSKEDIKKALQLYSDPLLFWATNTAVEALRRINPEDYDIWENRFSEWCFLTQRLLWRFGLFQIVECVCQLYQESAEQYWTAWTPPNLEEEERESKVWKDWRSG